MPERIQRQRTKGWRMPEGAVYVGRPSQWGNPFFIAGPLEYHRLRAIEFYRRFALEVPGFAVLVQQELAGKDLACWCPLDAPCHADVLLEIANGDTGEKP